MARTLHRRVCVSTATRPLDDTDVRRVLARARRRNREAGVTGVMLYCEGSFLQLFEGPARGVERVFARVEKDAEHHHLITLADQTAAVREFEDQAMAFHAVTAREFSALSRARWTARGGARSTPGLRMLGALCHACEHC